MPYLLRFSRFSVAAFVGVTICWGFGAGMVAAADLPIVNIGVVIDGPWEGNQLMYEWTVEEVTTLTDGEFDVRIPDSSYHVGDWTYDTAQANVQRVLANDDIDLIITWGVLASQAVCCVGELPKPVVAPVVLNAELLGLPFAGGVSGQSNLGYVELPNSLEEEIRIFRDVVPFDTIAVLVNGELFRAIPGLSERSAQSASQAGVNAMVVPVGFSVSDTLAAIPDGAEAVYMWPQLHWSQAQLQQLVDSLAKLGKPVFSSLGGEGKIPGALASAAPADYLPRLARRVALNIQRILLGEDAGAIPVRFSHPTELVIDMDAARKVGISPTYSALLEAELLNADAEELPQLTILDAVEEAVRANLALEAERRALRAAGQDVVAARAELLPQLGLSASRTQIDEDRAAASFGSQAEGTTTAGLALTQVLYSNPAWANLRIQRLLQSAREQTLEASRLDAVFSSSTAYLDVLRAASLVEVQRNNLRVTQSNLRLAQRRRDVGSAGAAEVLRWESQIALDRKNLIDAIATQHAARFALNRETHRPLEDEYALVPVSVDDPLWTLNHERFSGFIETPSRFQVFRDFAVQEGLAVSPELQAVDEQIAAQERALTAAKRAYWAPTFGLQAAWDVILSRDGAGADGASLAIPGLSLPRPDDTNWSLSLFGSLDLFAGGRRSADVVAAEETLAQLRTQREVIAEGIEQQIRTAMQLARSSYLGISLLQEAAVASQRNLELVSDSYARGVVSIQQLIDAQGAALNAQQGAVSAEYDFLGDLLAVQRATSRFDFESDPEQRAAWFDRLDQFVRSRGLGDWNGTDGEGP